MAILHVYSSLYVRSSLFWDVTQVSTGN